MTNLANDQITAITDELRQKGHTVPSSVHEIDNLPYDSFEELLEALRARSALVQRFSVAYESGTFNLFASGSQKLLNNTYMAIAFLGPVAAIVLVVLHSWWWLPGVLLPFVGLSRTKRLYNRVILSAAMSSEAAFCFLYYTRQVCVTTADFNTSYYWDIEEDPPA